MRWAGVMVVSFLPVFGSITRGWETRVGLRLGSFARDLPMVISVFWLSLLDVYDVPDLNHLPTLVKEVVQTE